MPAVIEIPSALQKFVNNRASVSVPEGSVKAAIDNLLSQYGTEWHLLAAGAFLLMLVAVLGMAQAK